MLTDGKYTYAGLGVALSFGLLFWIIFDWGPALTGAFTGSLAYLLGLHFGQDRPDAEPEPDDQSDHADSDEPPSADSRTSAEGDSDEPAEGEAAAPENMGADGSVSSDQKAAKSEPAGSNGNA